MPPEFLSGTAPPGQSCRQFDRKPRGFAGPYLVWMVQQATHGFAGGILLMAASLIAAGLLALTLPAPLRETDQS